ncbi:MAG: single-stranded DNA-binding protein [Candidatus Ventricola sp.]
MNTVQLIGNLTAKPKMIQTASGVAKSDFMLAVQRAFVNKSTGEREADFIPVVAWSGTAEICGKYLDKGSRCAVIGHIQTRRYEAQDGTKRYVTEVVAERVEFLDSRKGVEGGTPGTNAPNAAQDAGFTPVDDEELPF